ncbi:hypothetical protein B0H13DRAFT_2282898 [Mycena leptocephala]|nr:hypothetical protein B0H13DRAFT_2282898 [Mycena leptocephala]
MREDAMGEPTVESIQERCRERKKRRTPALPCVFRLPGRRRGELGLDVAGCVTHARCPLAAPVALSAVATVEGGRGQAGGSRAGLGLRPGMRIVRRGWYFASDDEGARKRMMAACAMANGRQRGWARRWWCMACWGWVVAWHSQLARVVRRLGRARGVTVVRRGASNVVMTCRLHLHSDGCWWSREMSWAKLEGGGDGAGGGREEKQREAAARGAAIQTIVADAERQYAEKREEDDQRERRTGYRTGAGVHEEGECEGERAERKAACVEEQQKAAAT